MISCDVGTILAIVVSVQIMNFSALNIHISSYFKVAFCDGESACSRRASFDPLPREESFRISPQAPVLTRGLMRNVVVLTNDLHGHYVIQSSEKL